MRLGAQHEGIEVWVRKTSGQKFLRQGQYRFKGIDEQVKEPGAHAILLKLKGPWAGEDFVVPNNFELDEKTGKAFHPPRDE